MMYMRELFTFFLTLLPLRLCFLSLGNSSDSSAASQSATVNTDKRLVADGASVATSLDIHVSGGSGKRAAAKADIYVLDGGAVQASFDFAERTAADLLGFTESTAREMTDGFSAARASDAKMIDAIAGLAGGQKTLVIGVLIIGGILALKFLGRQKL